MKTFLEKITKRLEWLVNESKSWSKRWTRKAQSNLRQQNQVRSPIGLAANRHVRLPEIRLILHYRRELNSKETASLRAKLAVTKERQERESEHRAKMDEVRRKEMQIIQEEERTKEELKILEVEFQDHRTACRKGSENESINETRRNWSSPR